MPSFKTSDASELLEPGLKSIFLNRFNRFKTEYTGWNNVMSSDRNFEEDLTFAGFANVPVKGESESVTFVDPIQGNVKRYNQVSYALGFRITREMWMDDMYGKMKGMSAALGVAFADFAEIRGASVLNNATATGAEFLGADGVALLSNAHPLLGGGTYSNIPTTPADLSYTAVQDGMIHFDELTDHMGIPINVNPEQVLYGPQFRFIAEEIFKQDAKPNTSDRDDNTVGNKGLTPKVLHYLTDSDAWFMLSNPSVDGMAGHSIQFIWRERPIFESYDDKDTKDVKSNGYARVSEGFAEAFGVYGSVGAA